ncbi:hypothetical protein EHI44_30845 [Rhizobium leguminosarum]|nr:hypothetical protein EHI44_30845 [Rhizobium leguminosarum]
MPPWVQGQVRRLAFRPIGFDIPGGWMRDTDKPASRITADITFNVETWTMARLPAASEGYQTS